MDQPPDHARCWTCNYELRGLATPRCPECGREFDPVNPNTMNLGKTPGTIGRFLLRRSGWLPIVILLIATGFVISATRWPKGGVMLTSLDLLYYFNSIHLHPKLLSYTDWAYTLGLLTAAAVVLLWLMKLPLREIARRMYRQPIPPPVNMGRRIMLGTIAILAMGGSIAIGWPYRIARAWVRQVMKLPPPTNPWPGFPVMPGPPVRLTEEQSLDVFRAAVMQLPTDAERMAALKLLVEAHHTVALPILLEAVGRERDPHLRATQIHVIGLYQDIATLPLLLSFWDDREPEVRAAVIDAIGWLHAPAYPMVSGKDLWGMSPWINTSPTIQLGSICSNRVGYSTEGLVDLPSLKNLGERVSYLRPRLEQRLIDGLTPAEREASARAILNWQSGYKLRVAEWGVWVCAAGQLALLKSIIDEIPPFVHRTGDSIADLDDRVHEVLMDVTKPVMHFTTDTLMVVDVKVLITKGRPWFAFPQPDDFTLVAEQFGRWRKHSGVVPALKRFDVAGMPSLRGAHEGYPWLDPSHGYVAIDPSPQTTSNEITSLGLRWQSVIVSPEKLSWMDPPNVPSDAKFSWWERLRNVPCSWVCNRGDSERFLYYDGPTEAQPPLIALLDESSLTVEVPIAADEPWLTRIQKVNSFDPMVTKINHSQQRQGLFLRVNLTGSVSAGCVIAVPGTTDLSKEPMLHGDALISRFHSLLTEAGLTDAEAAGLVDCWRPQFFQTPGSRFILLMSAYDYDRLCPIRIDPPPTELVRVGLVLTEFARN